MNVNGLGAIPITQAQGSGLDANDVAGYQRLVFHNNLFWNVGVRPAMTTMKGVVRRATDAEARSRSGTGVVSADQLTSAVASVAFGPSTRVRYDAPGTYTFIVPAGVYSIEAELWGAGGGGGYNTIHDGAPSGGASGAYAKKRYSVTPGQAVTIVVGVGGTGGAASPAQAGQPGTNSSVTAGGVTVTANGGAGGKNATISGVSADVPNGGAYSGADFGLRGEDGHIGYVAGSFFYGGSGGAAPFGGGEAAGGAGTPAGGFFPGGGGGGTGDYTIAGGLGSNGSVVIQHTQEV